MNRDDIIRMAEIACNGKPLEYFNGWGVVFDHNQLEQFANLVAAAEREANKDRIETLYQMYKMASQQRDELMRQQTDAIRERGAPALERLNKAAEDNGEPL